MTPGFCQITLCSPSPITLNCRVRDFRFKDPVPPATPVGKQPLPSLSLPVATCPLSSRRPRAVTSLSLPAQGIWQLRACHKNRSHPWLTSVAHLHGSPPWLNADTYGASPSPAATLPWSRCNHHGLRLQHSGQLEDQRTQWYHPRPQP